MRLLQKPFNALAVGVLGTVLLSLPGCGISLPSVACDVTGGDPHCNQEAAVESGNADNCDTVAQKEEFKKVGSNPPRDKCVVMVSANNEDPKTCKKAQGGLLSYSEKDCLEGVAETAHEPATCSTLGGEYAKVCANSVAKKTMEDIDEFNKKPKRTAEDIRIMQLKMQQLGKMQQDLTEIIKAEYEMKMTVVKNLRI